MSRKKGQEKGKLEDTSNCFSSLTDPVVRELLDHLAKVLAEEYVYV